MLSVQQQYLDKKRTAEQTLDLLKDGDNIIVPTGVGEPPELLTTLSEHRLRFKGVKVWQLLAIKPYAYMDPATTEHVKHSSYFLSGTVRQGANEGWIDLLPCHFSSIPRLIKQGELPADVVYSIASSMDENGNFSLSLGADYTMAAVSKARAVILEVNPNVPFCGGDCHVHISQVTALVESNLPVTSVPSGEIGDIEKAIAKHVANLINDGDTLQIGFGSIPDAVVTQLTDKKDLGIHTEVLGDGIITLLESGAITGAKKTLKPGKIVATFAVGTERLYKAMHKNPIFEIHPADFINNPSVASQNDNLVAINGTMQVDFSGQCASETIGTRLYSSTGGQTDFIRTANMSKGGRAMIVTPSTAKNGAVSRIVPTLTEGAHVSTHKNDVDYVITEFGVAKLRNKTLRERALALIAIAHPDFREELTAQAKARKLL